MRVARRQRCGVGAGSRRGSVGRCVKAALGGRRRVRRAAGQRGAAGHSRRAYRPHVRWAPARRPAASRAAQPRSQQTPLARPQTWALLCTPSRAVARLALAHLPAVLLKRVVGRSLSPSVVRPCAWHAARAAAWGPDRAAVAWGARERCVGRAPSFAWGAAGRTRYACRYRRAHARQVRWAPARRPAANAAAQHRSQRTPLAWPGTWVCFSAPSCAVACLGREKLPAAPLKHALGCPQPVTPRRTAGPPDIPGIPDSRTYRAAGHTGQPGSRTYRAAGHTGQPDSRAYRAAGPPDIYSARVKARRFLKGRFTASRYGKAALWGCPSISRAEYTGQPDIPDRRTAGHTGQPDIPGSRTYRAAGHTGHTASPRPQPNIARSRHRWRGREPGRF